MSPGRVARWHDTGEVVAAAIRFNKADGGKEFRPVSRDGSSWVLKAPASPRPLYRLHDLVSLPPDVRVYICEGEKAADAAWKLGLPATTSFGGAQAAAKTDWGPLAGRDVVSLPDNDEAGRKYPDAQILPGLNPRPTLRIVALPDLPAGGDIVEFSAARKAAGDSPTIIRDAVDELAEAAPVVNLDDVLREMDAIGERAISTTGSEIMIPVDVKEERWPSPPSVDAFYGLAGEFVALVEPHSEADPVALLLQFLVGFGNVIGRSAHFTAESHRHYCNLNCTLVGNTSKGRKGSSLSHARRVLGMIDEPWATNGIVSGLSSGEGLIWQVRDPIEQQTPVKEKGRVVGYDMVTTDPGILDKRLLVIEEEFVRVLASMGRENNTLSALLRQAWDTGDLRTMTKSSPARSTGAHVSIVAHVTRDELRRAMAETEHTNGFANRFLWACVRRSKSLPEGGRIDEVDMESFVYRLREAVAFAAGVGRLDRDDAARARWAKVYGKLSEGRSGLIGAVTARAEAQVMRLACIYALLDKSPVVRLEHLEAALAVWDYCERSAAYIFVDSLGDKLSDDLWMAIRASGEAGMSRTAMRDMFGRNKNEADIARALGKLCNLGRIELVPPESGKIGKPAECWRAKSQNDRTTLLAI